MLVKSIIMERPDGFVGAFSLCDRTARTRRSMSTSSTGLTFVTA